MAYLLNNCSLSPSISCCSHLLLSRANPGTEPQKVIIIRFTPAYAQRFVLTEGHRQPWAWGQEMTAMTLQYSKFLQFIPRNNPDCDLAWHLICFMPASTTELESLRHCGVTGQCHQQHLSQEPVSEYPAAPYLKKMEEKKK